MTSLSQLRRQLEAARATMPVATVDDHLFHGTSEQAYRELQRLVAEVEASPATELIPFDPADYSPADAALILKVEGMQSELLASQVKP